MFSRLSKRKRHWLILPLLFSIESETQADYLSLPCDKERQSADISLRRIENEWPLRGSSDAVSQYVQELGVHLAQLTADGGKISWHFSVVRNLAPNAFSIGNGYVFVTEGALNLAQNESEFAAILAHEIGHELAGHFCGESRSSLFDGMFDIFSGPKSPQYRVGIGSLTQVIDPVKEQQADHIALFLLQRGGFNPHAMLDISLRLPFGTTDHFSDAFRLQALRQALAGIPSSRGKLNSNAFMAVKRMLSGE